MFRIIIVSLLLAGIATTGWAQTLAPSKIAVLDSSRVLRQSKAAKSISTQLQKYRETYRQKTLAEEKALKNEGERLRKQKASLSKAAFEKAAANFREKQTKLAGDVQERTARLAEVRRRALKKLDSELVIILGVLAVDVGANIVIDVREVAYYAVSMDITDRAIERLDKKITHIALANPASLKK